MSEEKPKAVLHVPTGNVPAPHPRRPKPEPPNLPLTQLKHPPEWRQLKKLMQNKELKPDHCLEIAKAHRTNDKKRELDMNTDQAMQALAIIYGNKHEKLGEPTGAIVEHADGAISREFEHGYAAFNPGYNNNVLLMYQKLQFVLPSPGGKIIVDTVGAGA